MKSRGTWYRQGNNGILSQIKLFLVDEVWALEASCMGDGNQLLIVGPYPE